VGIDIMNAKWKVSIHWGVGNYREGDGYRGDIYLQELSYNKFIAALKKQTGGSKTFLYQAIPKDIWNRVVLNDGFYMKEDSLNYLNISLKEKSFQDEQDAEPTDASMISKISLDSAKEACSKLDWDAQSPEVLADVINILMTPITGKIYVVVPDDVKLDIEKDISSWHVLQATRED
jgi:hypothetical protein